MSWMLQNTGFRNSRGTTNVDRKKMKNTLLITGYAQQGIQWQMFLSGWKDPRKHK